MSKKQVFIHNFSSLYIKNFRSTKPYNQNIIFYLSSLMAHFAKPLSFFFLILVSTFLHVEATERLFFSKVTHISTKNAMAMDTESPSSAPTETSKGSAKTAAATTAVAATTADSTVVFPYDENEIQTEKLSDENYKKEETATHIDDNNRGYSYSQNNYNAKTAAAKSVGSTVVFPYDENEIQTEELSDENYKKEETAGYADNNDNYNSGYSKNQNTFYNANGYTVREKLGMSDTRFLENGKYYYNAKSEDNYYRAYGHDSGAGNGNIMEGYDNGNGENEFDSMEEYERQQGYYPRSQGEYIP